MLIAHRALIVVELRLRKNAAQLASRVLALPVSSFPLRPSVSRETTGIPVPSMAMYILGTALKGTTLPDSVSSRSAAKTASICSLSGF
jgi:hypothetical protein